MALPVEQPIALGTRIRSIRLSRGLKQSWLGPQCGVTGRAIENIEHGKCDPSWKTLMKIIAAFRMTQVEFFSWSPDVEPAMNAAWSDAQQAQRGAA